MKINVIGAGVVGLATAYFLARDGHAVTVIDKNTGVGLGTSHANGGQLSYDYVAPLASPSLLASLPGLLARGGGTIRFTPVADIGQLRWLLSFLLACNDKRSRRSTMALLSLADLSRRMLHKMIAAEQIAFEHRRNGKIVFYSTPKSLDAARRQMDLQAEFGSRQAMLTTAECIEIEPSLVHAADRMVGAIHTPSEETGDCRALCEGLARVLRAPTYGASFLFGRKDLRFVRSGGRNVRLLDGNEPLDADLHVICAGVDSPALARTAGLRLPIWPIHGYSLSLPILRDDATPESSITDYQKKIVYARLGHSLRVAGFAEIRGREIAIDGNQIRALRREAETLFPEACAYTQATPWAGARPATPTSVPIIARTVRDNLLINAGQGALGFTLACGSARLLADIIAGRPVGYDGNDLVRSDFEG